MGTKGQLVNLRITQQYSGLTLIAGVSFSYTSKSGAKREGQKILWKCCLDEYSTAMTNSNVLQA